MISLKCWVSFTKEPYTNENMGECVGPVSFCPFTTHTTTTSTTPGHIPPPTDVHPECERKVLILAERMPQTY